MHGRQLDYPLADRVPESASPPGLPGLRMTRLFWVITSLEHEVPISESVLYAGTKETPLPCRWRQV